MKKWLPLVLVFLAVLAGVWFWSLGALPDMPALQAVLASATGNVQVNGQSVSTGKTLTDNDVIKTGADGDAVISWFGQGETHLGPDTAITISQVSKPAEGSLSLGLRLETGRVWTRLMRLLDVNSQVQVQTSDVVATVRGTAFDLQEDGTDPTTLWVSDSAVEAAAAKISGAPVYIGEGMMAKFTSGKRASSTQPITASGKASDWFKQNHADDQKFRDAARERLRAWIGLDRLPSTGFFRTLVQASEGLRSKFLSGAVREQASTRYLLRRLAVIRRIIEEGKSGLAFQEFSRLETELKQRTDANDPSDMKSVRTAIRLSEYLYDDVGPDDSAYRIKQSLEDWRVNTAETPGEKMYYRLLAVDARLDEAAAFIINDQNDKAGISLDLARQSLDNIDRETNLPDAGIDASVKPALQSKSKALRARAAAIEANAAIVESTTTEPVISVPTSTPPVAPTSTEPVISVPTSTPPVTPPAALVPASLRVDPPQSALVFGESVSFRAIVIYQNGLTKDVTKLTAFTYSPSGYGALNGNIFKASQLRGTITITGSYQQNGVSVFGTSAVTIVDKP